MNTIETYSSNNPAKVWRNYTYDLDVGSDIAKYVAREHYAWPGGYELFVITDDGGLLCFDCCRSEFTQIIWDEVNDCSTGWRVTAMDSMASYDEPHHCDHCSRVIS
jgi:hypothetical protein